MSRPLSHALVVSIDRTADRLWHDYADAYHGLPERSSLPPPLEVEFALGALRRALRRDRGPLQLPRGARRALDQAAPTMMGLISRWPDTLQDATAAWELALSAAERSA